MKQLQRIEKLISPVQDCGQGLTTGKCPRQSLIELAAGRRALAGIEIIVILEMICQLSYKTAAWA